MTSVRQLFRQAMVLLTTTILVACASVPAGPIDEQGQTVETGGRHGLRDGFMRAPPSCVVVLPVNAGTRPQMPPELVERAVERFLAVRFDRVIAGAYRDRLARHLALDVGHAKDLGVFATRSDCRHALSIKLSGGALSYAVVWAERRLALQLDLFRIGGDGEPVWSSSADGSRGDGGLPVSPFGIASALYRAGKLAGDADQSASLLDDMLRRMMADLPDVRGFAAVPDRSRGVLARSNAGVHNFQK